MAKIWNLLPWRRRRLEEDLVREVQYHLDTCVADLRRRGLSEAEAWRRAAIELGAGVAQIKEETRETWIWSWLDNRARDIRYASRALRRNPGFTATAALSLALGIGANTAIFSVLDQVLLRSLAVREPEQLTQLIWQGAPLSTGWGNGYLLSYPLCRDLQEQTQLFDGVLCRHPKTMNFAAGPRQESLRGEIVSGSYFSTLGASAAMGRLLDASDDVNPGSHPVVVLSHSYWKNSLGSTPDVIGGKVLVNGYPMTVIGITQPGFSGIDPQAPPALWIPAMMAEKAGNVDAYWNHLLDRRARWVNVVARLKPGITAARAQTALQPWFKAMLDADTRREGFPPTTAEQRRAYFASTLNVTPAPQGLASLRGYLEKPLWVLMSGSLLLLLLACVNVASLFLARGATRVTEVTTRLAIGATRSRISSQLLTESVFIALAGGVVGLAAAPTLLQALLTFLPQDKDLPSRIDFRVLAFAVAASIVTAALCALAPVFQTRRLALIASLNQRSQSAASGGVRLRKLLVAGQIAFTLVLLVGAGLFIQTLTQLHERVGFSGSNLLMVRLNPPGNGYSESDAERVMREVNRGLKEIPAVENVAVANSTLLSGGMSTISLILQSPGQSGRRGTKDVSRMRVGPGFFTTLGTHVVAGRDFNESDVRPAGAKPTQYRTVIVNESFARKFFDGRSPIGALIGFGNRPTTVPTTEIIGVVRDFSRRTLRDEGLEQIFVPFWDQNSGDGVFYLRARGDEDSASTAIRAAVARVDPALPIKLIQFEEQVDLSLRTERMLATLSSGFGAIALILAVVGLYGVMSFVVTHRKPEIAVRLALGATSPTVIWLVVRDALVMIVAGTAVALPSIWLLRRLVEAQLFGVTAADGPTIAAAVSLLAIVAIGAALFPSCRATLVSPTDALRSE